MRIGIISPYDILRFGGVQEHILAEKSELKRRGHDVKILAPSPPSATDVDFKQKQDIIFLGQSTKVKALKTTAELTASLSQKEIEAVFNKHEFDILHFHEPWVPFLSRQLLYRSRALNVATFHAKLPDTFVSKTIEKATKPYTKSILKYVDAITAVSDAAAEYVKRLTDKKIHIIPNGIDLEKYNPETTDIPSEYNDDIPTIVYVGRLEKRKGVNFLLRAYRKLNQIKPNVRLLIAGSGPKLSQYKTYVNKHNLSNCHFLGYVDEKTKLSLLKRADIFCSPAIYGESFGIVLLEAMAMQTPIIAGNNPGYSGVLKGRGSFGLVDPRNITEFTNKLLTLISDQSLRHELVDWGNKEVKKYDYKKIVNQYEDLFNVVRNK